MMRAMGFMKKLLVLAVLPCTLMLSSCFDKGCIDPAASNYDPTADKDDGSCNYPFADDLTKADFGDDYGSIAHAMYEDAYLQAEAMRELIYQFVENPTIPGLAACQDAWVLAHIPYSQAEVLRFPESPVETMEQRINAWGFNPGYIDYLQDTSVNSIISQTEKYPTLDAQLLFDLNGTVEGKRITLGYHVIEFLLWGEDRQAPGQLTAGARTFKDYNTNDTTVTFASRRGEYLKLVADQLVSDLSSLATSWSVATNNNFRQSFEGWSPRKRTRVAITGLVLFGQYELGVDRLEGTLTSDDPEREESTFSDNTQRDIYFNALGMRAVFNGRYGRTDSTYVEGTNLYDVVAERDSMAANELKLLLDNVVERASLIPAPYDYNVSLEQGRGIGPVTDLYVALQKFGNRMTEVAQELNMGIEKDLPIDP